MKSYGSLKYGGYRTFFFVAKIVTSQENKFRKHTMFRRRARVLFPYAAIDIAHVQYRNKATKANKFNLNPFSLFQFVSLT